MEMAGESAHSRPESSSSTDETERELPHVRETWEEREGEREQEEGEGEGRRDQGMFGNRFVCLCHVDFLVSGYHGIMLRVHWGFDQMV